MRTFDGYKKRSLDSKKVLLADGSHTDVVIGKIEWDSDNRTLKWTKVGDSTSTSVLFGSNAFDSTSYLPLSGGTLTGNLTIQGNLYLPSLGEGFEITGDPNYFGTNCDGVLFTIKDTNLNSGVDGGIVFRSLAYNSGTLKETKDWLVMRYGGGDNYGTFTWMGKTIYHSGNFTPSDYLLLSGGTVTGQVSFTKVNDHAIKVGTIRGTTVGSLSGEYIHMYERVHIGGPSGWGASNAAAPTRGLSVYGTTWLAASEGSVGIGTTSPSYKLDVNGDIWSRGILRIGSTAAGPNYIAFYGVTGDSPGNFDHTYIGERIWNSSTEASELLLFKGNDVGNGTSGTTGSGAGPDRIRHIANSHVFQTYGSALSGTFEAIGSSTATSTKLDISNSQINVYTTLSSNSTIKSTYYGPAFLAEVAAGSWAYLRLKSGSTLHDVAVNTSTNSGALELRYGGGDTNKTSFLTNGCILQYGQNLWLNPAHNQIGRPDTTVYTDRTCMGATDGNLHLDAYKDKGLYLNYYSSKGNVYFNGSSYYINGGNYNGTAANATNSDKVDGYHALNVDDAFNRSQVLDLRGLSESTFYPCYFVPGTSRYALVNMWTTLDGYNTTGSPGWATHGSGIVFHLRYEVTSYGWGTLAILRKIHNFHYNWTNKNPFGGMGLLTNNSVEYIYLRGGARYLYHITGDNTLTILTSTTTFSGQSVGPISDNGGASAWDYHSGSGFAASTIYSSGFYLNSDIRFKNIEKYLTIPIKKFAKLPLFDFTWTNGREGKYSGTSALDVQKILPHLVTGDTSLTLDYATLGTIAGITACRELLKHENEITKLKDTINKLRSEINELKTQLNYSKS